MILPESELSKFGVYEMSPYFEVIDMFLRSCESFCSEASKPFRRLKWLENRSDVNLSASLLVRYNFISSFLLSGFASRSSDRLQDVVVEGFDFFMDFHTVNHLHGEFKILFSRDFPSILSCSGFLNSLCSRSFKISKFLFGFVVRWNHFGVFGAFKLRSLGHLTWLRFPKWVDSEWYTLYRFLPVMECENGVW